MINIKQFKSSKITIMFFVFIFAITLTLIFTNNVTTYAATAGVVCKDIKGANLDKCKAYIKAYNKCDSIQTASQRDTCRTTAYQNYIKDACGTGQKAVTCQGNGLGTVFISELQAASEAPSVTENYLPDTAVVESVADNPIIEWIRTGINLLAGIIGIGSIIMIIVAGIQYTASRDNPQAVQAAKTRIVNVLIGLASFIFLWAFLQWLVPGGVF